MHSRGMEWDSSEDLEQLEELGDDAIIAQQSGAHPLKPQTRVVTEPRTIVVADQAAEMARSYTPSKSSRAEATVVIRDRRKLDKMREKIGRDRGRSGRTTRADRLRAFYVWGGVGALAFVIGGLAAFFVSGGTSQAAVPSSSAPAASLASPSKESMSVAAMRTALPKKPEPAKAAPAELEVLDLDELPQEGTPEVKLDELPVEKPQAESRR